MLCFKIYNNFVLKKMDVQGFFSLLQLIDSRDHCPVARHVRVVLPMSL